MSVLYIILTGRNNRFVWKIPIYSRTIAKCKTDWV